MWCIDGARLGGLPFHVFRIGGKFFCCRSFIHFLNSTIMKKSLALIAVISAVALAACGKKEEAAAPAAAPAAAEAPAAAPAAAPADAAAAPAAAAPAAAPAAAEPAKK